MASRNVNELKLAARQIGLAASAAAIVSFKSSGVPFQLKPRLSTIRTDPMILFVAGL
jgi:hypothetical protein